MAELEDLVRRNSGVTQEVTKNEMPIHKGFYPGGKQKASAPEVAVDIRPRERFVVAENDESPPSVRLWARGLDGHDDIQRFLHLLPLDVNSGKITIKAANFYLNNLRTRIGIFIQTEAQGRAIHLMPAIDVGES